MNKSKKEIKPRKMMDLDSWTKAIILGAVVSLRKSEAEDVARRKS